MLYSTVRKTLALVFFISVSNLFGQNLNSTLSELNSRSSEITSLIPNRYDFTYDGSNNISDGGDDMYDTGNILNTNVTSNIPYSENAITASTAFGTSGEYFTRNFTGLFVMAASLDNISSFNTSGGTGADNQPASIVGGYEIVRTVNGKTYRGYIKEIYNTPDPSINHLIIVEDNGASETHTFPTGSGNSDLDEQTISSLSDNTELYYLLYASRDASTGLQIPQASHEAIMDKFLEIINGGNVALDFDGVDDVVNIGDNIEGLSEVTMEAWVYYSEEAAQHNEMLTKQNVYSWSISTTHKMWWHVGSGSGWLGTAVEGTSTIPTDVWTHVAMTWDGMTTKMYINGALDHTETHAHTMGVNAVATGIGNYGSGNTNPFEGSIDELRVWDRVKSDAEILANYNRTVVTSADGLIAYYDFSDGTGTTLTDQTGSANGTISGATWITTGPSLGDPLPSTPTNVVAYENGGNITIEWTDVPDESSYKIYRSATYNGTFTEVTTLGADVTTAIFAENASERFYRVAAVNAGGETQSATEHATTEAFAAHGMQFTALSDRVVVSNPESFGENLITVEAWINTTSTTAYSRVAACGDGGAQRWSLSLNGTGWGFSTGKVVAAAQFSGGNTSFAASTTNVNDGQWHHVAATFDLTTTTVQIYVDGVLENSGSSSGSPYLAAANVNLGNFYTTWNQSLEGQLDEVKIWNNIKSDFSDRFGPVDLSVAQPNLIAYYPLDENGGTTVVDRSVNNNDGTISGATFVSSEAGLLPAPTLYNATAASTTAFTANWEAVSGADDLTIEWGTGGSFANSTVLSGGDEDGSSSVVSASLTAGTIYEYRIKYSSGIYESGYSNEVSFMLDAGNAVDFPGTAGQEIIAPFSSITGAQARTLEFWMKGDNTSQSSHPVTWGALSAGQAFGIEAQLGNLIFFGYSTGNYDTGYDLDTDWHHIAVTYDGTTVRTYVDGSPTPITAQARTLNTAAGNLVMGTRLDITDSYLVDGQIDDVRIWSIEKTDFSDRFDRLVGNEANLEVYYTFDQTGSPVADLSGNGIDGVIGGGVTYTSSGAMTPSGPAVYNATAVTSSAFTANWEIISGGADDLTIEWGTGGSFANNTVLTGGAEDGSSAIVSTALTAGTVYEYRIKATIGGMETAYSDAVSFMVAPGNTLPFTGTQVVFADDVYGAFTQLSVEAWILPSSSQGGEGQIVSQSTSGVASGWELRREGTNLRFTFRSSNGTQYSALNTITQDVWQHVAGTWDGSQLIAYVNGVPGTPVGTIGQINDHSFRLGIGDHDGSARKFIGSIDEVRIWDDHRTAGEITGNMSSELTGVEDNLIGYYRFDQTSGLNLPDLSTTGNDGDQFTGFSGTEWTASGAFADIIVPQIVSGPTLTNLDDIGVDITWQLDEPGDIHWGIYTADNTGISGADVEAGAGTGGVIFGARNFTVANTDETQIVQGLAPDTNYWLYYATDDGTNLQLTADVLQFTTTSAPENAAQLDGVDDYFSHGRTFFASGLTFEGWVKTTSTDAANGYNGNPAMPLIGDTNNAIRGAFGVHAGKVRYTHWTGSGTTFDIVESTSSVNDGNWHHIAVTHDQSTSEVNIFVDGVVENTLTVSTYQTVMAFDAIGYSFLSANTDYFEGDIDEVRIWNRALSDTEIQTNIFSSLTTGTGLLSSYSFNQSSYTLLDQTTTENNGALNGGVGYVASTALSTVFPVVMGPGGITSNLSLWLKADADVIGTTEVSQWDAIFRWT